MKRAVSTAVIVVVIALALTIGYLSILIERQSKVDEARPADVILVLGAAEYRGRPSQVLRARLDHALDLYRQGMAPRILTTGGAGGEKVFTEGGVGRSYLIGHGVPPEAVIAETGSDSTVESTAMAGEIMRRMGLRSVIVVSDGYHVYRVKRMLQMRRFHVYGSPRKDRAVDSLRDYWNCVKQAIGYLLWRAGVAV